MKKVGIALLWIIGVVAGLFLILIMFLLDFSEESIQYPGTIICPCVGLGWFAVGDCALALGLHKDWKRVKFFGLIILVISVVLLLISKPINDSIGLQVKISLLTAVGLILALTAISMMILACVLYPYEHEEDTSQAKNKRENKYEREANRILKTKLIDTSRTTMARVKTGSALARGIIGELIAGPIGGLAGVASAGQRITEKTKISFLVYYKDGSKDVKVVDRNSKMFQVYLNKLEDSQTAI